MSTFAGSSQPGQLNGSVTVATFYEPEGLNFDGNGNLFINDYGNSSIRQINTVQVVSTLATITNATTGAMAIDASGNLYVGLVGSRIEKVSPTGVVDSIPGDQRLVNLDYEFYNLTCDAAGNIYGSEVIKNIVFKITPAGVVSTLAGSGYPGHIDGAGAQASFATPAGMAADASGNIYVADQANATIRKITAAGEVSTIPGYSGSPAMYHTPYGIAVDQSGNIYVTDHECFIVRKITPAGVASTVAGVAYTQGDANGAGNTATFSYLSGITVDSQGNLFVTDSGNNQIRKITFK